MIKINGIAFETSDDLMEERTVTEEYDIGEVTVYNNRKDRYEFGDKVEINDHNDFIVLTDLVTEISFNTHEHKISLVENLSYFDKQIPSDRLFSKITRVNGQTQLMTISEIFEVYRREFKTYNNIEIELETNNTGYENTQVPLKQFTGLIPFSLIISDLFRIIGANPKVKREGAKWIFYPQYWNTRNNDISNTVELRESQVQQTGSEDYATEIKSTVEKAVNETIEQEYYPSKNGYVQPKSPMRIPAESTLRYELDSNILIITEAIAEIVYIPAENDPDPVGTQILSGPETGRYIFDLDITKYVVTEEEADALPVPLSGFAANFDGIKNARNVLRYKPGERFIGPLFETGLERVFFAIATDYLKNAIKTAFEEAVDEGVFFSVGQVDRPILREVLIDVRTQKMRFRYIKERNYVTSEKKQFLGNMNQTQTMHRQRDAQTEINRFKNSLSILANRAGNAEITKTQTIKEGEPQIEIFDYIGTSVITHVRNTKRNEQIYQEYTIAQNYANANLESARSVRSNAFTITDTQITTNPIYNEFLIIKKTLSADLTILTEKGRNTFYKTFEGTPTNEKPITGAVYTLQPSLPFTRIHRIPSTSTGGNISFNISFDSPIVAGFKYDSDENENEPIIYTEEDGTVEDFSFFFTEDVDIIDNGEYPLILDQNYVAFATGALTGDGFRFPIDLDPKTRLGLTYQINPQVEDAEIIIYPAFNTLNYLVKVGTINFQVYTKNKPYTYFDEEIGSPVFGATYSFNRSIQRMRFQAPTSLDRFALVANGKLFIAFNEPLIVGLAKDYFVTIQSKFIPPVIEGTKPLIIGFSLGPAESTQQELEQANTNEINVNFNYQLAASTKQELQAPNIDTININFNLGQAESDIQLEGIANTDELSVVFNLGPATGAQQELQEANTDEITFTFTLELSESQTQIVQEANTQTINTVFGLEAAQSEAIIGPPPAPTLIWVPDSTPSNVWDVSVDLVTPQQTCPTVQTGLTIIEANAPAQNQQVGDRGRVTAFQDDGQGGLIICPEQRYRVEQQ